MYIPIVDVLKSASRTAGETLLSFFHHELSLIHKTDHQNILTKADLASQEAIKTYITNALHQYDISTEDIGFIGEEHLSIGNTKKHVFVIDPLDGTNNFASGYDYFGVSIGYVHEGILTAGVIYRPSTDTFYFAEKGKGAYCTDLTKTRQMKIKHTSLQDSVVLSYISSRPNLRIQWFEMAQKINPVTRGIRILGSCALDLVQFSDPVNCFNICINAHAYIWDIAAAKLILEEAGGVLTDWKGNPTALDMSDSSKGYSILACHPDNLKEIVGIINT